MQQQSGLPVLVRLLPQNESLPSEVDGIALNNVIAEPLSLDDWFKYQKGEALSVIIKGTVDSVRNTSGIEAPKIGDLFESKLQLDPTLKNDNIALVDGGWLPLFYCLPGTNIFLDRNAVSEIKAKFHGGKLQTVGQKGKDYFDLLAQQTCGCVLNPLPFALEGNATQLPSPEMVVEQIEIALGIIKEALPHIQVWPDVPYTFDQISVLLKGYQSYFSQGMAFLKIVAPSLMKTTGKAKRQTAWKTIISAAKETGISTQHISVVIALSALTADQSFNPAKKVLKPSENYSDAQAYNAMWDIFLLFLLREFQVECPEHPFALLTRDKNLALLWMGMMIHTTAKTSGAKPEIFFDERLMSCDPEEMVFLQTLLGENNIRYEHPLI